MLSMIRFAALFAALAATTAGALRAQLPPLPSVPLRTAYFAWSEGRYGDALDEYLRILDVARDPDLLDEIAVLTGELYEVHEVTTDGLDIQVAPDGSTLGYRVDSDSVPRVHVVRVGSAGTAPVPVAVVDAVRFALGPGERFAYLTLGDEARLAAPRAAMAAARARQSALEFRAAEAEVRWLEATTAELRVLDLASGDERTVQLDGRTLVDWAFLSDGSLLVATGAQAGEASTDLHRVAPGATALASIEAPSGFKTDLITAGSDRVVFTVPASDPAPREPGTFQPEQPGVVHVGTVDLGTGQGRTWPGEAPSVSRDGGTLVWVQRPEGFVRDRIRFPHGPGGALMVARLNRGDGPVRLFETSAPLGVPTVSPDGTTIAFARMDRSDWEVFVRPADGGGSERRVTDEIQHDQFPRFVSRGTVLAAKGEGRHRRSYLYDLAGGRALELFHNNTVRTIAPEYEWVVSPTEEWVAIVAERDGDTVSPERGVYLVDLTRRVTREALVARLERARASEDVLRRVGDRLFAGIEDSVRVVTEAVSSARVHDAARTLYSFGSKHISRPGNQAATRYIVDRLREFGYDPQLQPFQGPSGPANVIAELPGHTDPNVLYVISSHFDSHVRGPGADDNSSGTTALLEVARVLRDHPQRATIQFVFVSGEESGLLGSRHYVGQLRAQRAYLAGALNNDMVGWANDHRLDNTIRYSNDGIRDLQHAAAMRFSRLITYDARYYKNTDAHAFFEGYGDIVGGIGSHPVLGNPHYHQATDGLETINHDLVAEVARTTAASIMALASHPSRPTGLAYTRGTDGGTRVRWTQVPEQDAVEYHVRFRASPDDDWIEETTTDVRMDLPPLPEGAEIWVKTLWRDGTEGWDWARLTLAPPSPSP